MLALIVILLIIGLIAGAIARLLLDLPASTPRYFRLARLA